MGLDIIAWQQATLNAEYTTKLLKAHTTSADDDLVDALMDEMCDNDIHHIYTSSFPEQAYPYKNNDCIKLSGNRMHFRAGSYGGYNQWRNQLAQLAHGVEAETVWDLEESYKDKAFFGLINFSDAEGVISHVTASKLAANFQEYYELAKKHTPDTGFFEKYEKFKSAFELASDGGVVIFS